MDAAEHVRLLAGRYRLDSVIGRGGMGTVWHAHDELLGRDVAVKEIIWPPHASEAEYDATRRRALREAQMAARLRHANIVGIFDILEEDDRPWIVMELLPYRSLGEIVAEDGPVPPERAAELGLGVLAGLRAAHEAGVSHRDVKPANILVSPQGRVVLTDFGIARAADSPVITVSGLLVGSPSYIAPERARGGPGGPASDLWGLGASLYTAVEGRAPFERGTMLASMTSVVADDPEPAARAGRLWPVISALLVKDPDQRLGAADAERLLRQVAKGGPRPWRFGARSRRGARDHGAWPGAAAEAAVAKADLAQADLEQADLAQADSGQAELAGAELEQANLAQADLAQADLAGADSGQAELAGAELTRAEPAGAQAARAAAGTAQPGQVRPAGPGTVEEGGSAGTVPAPAAGNTREPAGSTPRTPGIPARGQLPSGPLSAGQAPPAESAELPPPAAPGRDSPGEPARDVSLPVPSPAGPARPAAEPPAAPGAARGPASGVRSRRRRVAALAAAAIVVVAGGVAAAIGLPRAAGHPGASSSPSPARPSAAPRPSAGSSQRPAPSPSGTPSSARTPASSGTPSAPPPSPRSGSAGASTAPPYGALPAGYYRFTNSTGFSIGVPRGWVITHSGHYVYVSDPADKNVYLLIDQSDEPKSDPLADWQQQAANRQGTYPDYHLIRLTAVTYPQAQKAADWEFTYDREGTMVHILNRNVLANSAHAYALYWSAPAGDWSADYHYFTAFAATFRPAPASG